MGSKKKRKRGTEEGKKSRMEEHSSERRGDVPHNIRVEEHVEEIQPSVSSTGLSVETSKSLQKKSEKTGNNTSKKRDDIPNKKRRKEKRESAKGGSANTESEASKRPREEKGESKINKKNRAEELKKWRKSEHDESAGEGPSLPINTVTGPSDQRGAKTPDLPRSRRINKRRKSTSHTDGDVNRSDTDGRSHKKHKRDKKSSEEKEPNKNKPSDIASSETRKLENGDSLPQVTAGVSGTQPASTPQSPTAPLSLESFTFHKVLGQGSYGKVMLASHNVSRHQLAVKMVQKRALVEDFRDCVRRERNILKATGRSPFFTHAYGTFQTSDYVFFVMEYLRGGELTELIYESSPFLICTTRFFAAEILCGLQFLHTRGVIHRDLKPDNILLDSTGHIKIADFGLAATNVIGDKKITGYAGTLGYIAPEIHLRQPYNATVDLFSFGVILYEMAVGEYPFYVGEESELVERSVIYDAPNYPQNLDPDIRDILERLLCKCPIKRQDVCNNLKGHPFFSAVNWVELQAGGTPPPFKMVPNPVMDTNKSIAVDELLSSTELQNTPLSLEDEKLFCGFSFESDRWQRMQKST